MRRSRNLILSLTAALALVLTLSFTLLAGPASATTVDDGVGPRVERACLRIPNLELRTEQFIERLDGDASVRGSLLWLADKAEAARKAGRDQLATVLENRLAVRTKTREVLDQRQEDLARLRTRCEELGVDL